jgi:molybdopterin molybdotransferase
MISFEQARAKVAAHITDRPTIRVKLDAALGTRLADPVIARVTRPPAAVSAMDGYAVRLADVSAPNTTLTMIGAAPAGAPFSGTLSSGQTVRIFTGGELPDCADHIIPQEDAEANGTQITILPASGTARFVREKGLDFSQGDQILAAGTWLGPAELAIAAAANCDEVTVHKRPIVALLANGDELKPAGSALKRGEIVNSNPTALSALIRQWGGDPVDLGIAGDTVESIQSYIRRAGHADIIVPVGGASVGDHDHMFDAFERLGFLSVFRKVAVKPGKPSWCSVKGKQTVLGLPGNPASALVCAHLFLKPLIDGSQAAPFTLARVSTDLRETGNRAAFLRSHAKLDDAGQLTVMPLANQDSSLLHPFLDANVLLHRPANSGPVQSGELVEVLPIAPLIP